MVYFPASVTRVARARKRAGAARAPTSPCCCCARRSPNANTRRRSLNSNHPTTTTTNPPPPPLPQKTPPTQLVNACFVLICWATADNLARMSGTLHLPSAPGAGAGWSAAEQTARAFVSKSAGIWRAPIAACAIGGLMAALFNVTSCLVLVRKSLLPPGASSFGYGFVTAWSLVLAFTMLLCGLVLESFKSTVRDRVDPETATVLVGVGGGGDGDAATAAATGAATATTAAGGATGWTRAMTGAYAASYGFAYVCTALYALFFLVLLGFQKAISRQLSGAQRAAIEIGAVAAATGGGVGGGSSALYSQARAI